MNNNTKSRYKRTTRKSRSKQAEKALPRCHKHGKVACLTGRSQE